MRWRGKARSTFLVAEGGMLSGSWLPFSILFTLPTGKMGDAVDLQRTAWCSNSIGTLQSLLLQFDLAKTHV
jgi:hypothetical protein